MKPRGKKVFLGLEFKLGFPAVFFLCLCFFLAGFFGSIIMSQDGMGVGLESIEVGENGSTPNGETGDSSIYSIPFQVLSWSPRAVYFPNFATAEECQSIIDMARSSLTPSGLAFRSGDTTENTKGLRTSSGTFIKASQDRTGILDHIENKIARVTMIPKSHGEPFNILRYEVGQRYVPHYDSFDPEKYGPRRSQRVASFLLYLTNVKEGGETSFPYEVAFDDNGSKMDTDEDYNNGCLGLKVKPRQGGGLLFYSLFINGSIDKRALHGSCPVIKGEKWVATKWIQDQVLL